MKDCVFNNPRTERIYDMKTKLVKSIFLILLAAGLAFSCACANTDKDGEKDEKQNEESKEDSRKDTDNKGGEDKKDEYAVPANFGKAYQKISALRNGFYDGIEYSLRSIGDDSRMYVDTYKAMAGETTFVYFTTFAHKSDIFDSIIVPALKIAGFRDPVMKSETEDTAVISVSVNVADQFEGNERFADAEFTLTFDKKADMLCAEYKVFETGEYEKFSAKRYGDGYIACHISEDEIIKYVLTDDGCGKMYVCDNDGTDGGLADAANFEPQTYNALYELTSTNFHSVYNGVEYTYPRAEVK